MRRLAPWSVLLLAACSGGAAAGETAVEIADFAFSPAEAVVAAGDTITWTNADTVAHTVTFDDGEGSDTLPADATFSRTFDAAGAFPYSCTIHPNMTASVTVE